MEEILLYNNNLETIRNLQEEKHKLLYNTPRSLRSIITTGDDTLIRRRCVVNQNLKIIREKHRINSLYCHMIELCAKVENIKQQILRVNYSVTDCKDLSNEVRNYTIVKTLKVTLSSLINEILIQYNTYNSQIAQLTDIKHDLDYDRIKIIIGQLRQISLDIIELEETNNQLKTIIQLKQNEMEMERINRLKLEQIRLEEEQKEEQIRIKLMKIEHDKEIRQQIKINKRKQR